MTTIELNARKMEIIEMLLQVDDEKTVSDIMAYIRKAKGGNPPCRFTVEEMKQRIVKAEDDIKNGRFISHEEIKRLKIKATPVPDASIRRMDIKEYREMAEEALYAAHEGQTISHEDLKKEMEQW